MNLPFSGERNIAKPFVALCVWAVNIVGSCAADEAPKTITGEFRIICPVVSKANVFRRTASWVLRRDEAPSLQIVGEPDSTTRMFVPLLKQIIDSAYRKARERAGNREVVLRSYLNNIQSSLTRRYPGATSNKLWHREFTERIPEEMEVSRIAEINWTPSIPVISSLEVIVVTRAAAMSGTQEPNIRRIGGRSLAERFRVDEFGNELNVMVVETRFAKMDVVRFWRWETGSRPGEVPSESRFKRSADSLSLELSSVAVRVLRILKDKGLRIGDIVTEQRRGEAETEIAALFPRLTTKQEENADASVAFDRTGKLTVTVARIPMIEEVRIREKVKPEARATAERADRSTRSDLVKRLTRHYLGSPGHPKGGHLYTSPLRVPTAEYVVRDARHLGESSSVAGAEPVAGENHESIIFDVTPRPKLFPKIVFTLAVGYSTEKSIVGKLSAETQNLPDEHHALSISYEGGAIFQDIRGDYEWHPSQENQTLPWKWKLDSVVIRGGGMMSDNFRLGNTDTASFAAQQEEAKAAFVLRRDNFEYLDTIRSEERLWRDYKRFRHLSKVEVGVEWNRFTFDESGKSTSGLSEGNLLYPYLRCEGHYLFQLGDEGSGLGKLEIEDEVEILQGINGLGGEFSFFKGSASLGAALFFGFRSNRDFILREAVTLGGATSGAPSFAYFRAGTPSTVRGLFEGESIGRTIFVSRTELAYSLFELIETASNAFRRSRKPEIARSSSPVEGVYLKAFCDIGMIGQQISNGVEIASGRPLQGFGIALELNGLKLMDTPLRFEIGYAYSPQSEVLRSGTIFSGASVDF